MRWMFPSFSENKKNITPHLFLQFLLAKSAEYRPSYGWNVSAAKTCATFPLHFALRHATTPSVVGKRFARSAFPFPHSIYFHPVLTSMEVLYEDNHVIIVNKAAGEIVQGDKTGDRTLADEVKAYIKQKYNKPGEVFLGTVHRLDRPVSGLVVFARTSKALTRLNEMFRRGDVHKTYHAIVPLISERPNCTWPTQVGEFVTLTHFLTRDEKRNKAFAHHQEISGAKRAVLDLGLLKNGERTRLVEIHLHTGRHHQIRCQLATIGFPIRGDLKYGAPRSNPDGSICLHARHISFIHPVSQQEISVTAPYPALSVWKNFA